jgi:hypothetical protein
MTLADKLSSALTTLFSELIHGAPRKNVRDYIVVTD